MRLPGESTVVAGGGSGLESWGDSPTGAREAFGCRAPPFYHEVPGPSCMTTWIVLMVFAVVAVVTFVLFAILTLRWLAVLIESRRHIEGLCRGAGLRIETFRKRRPQGNWRRER